MNENLQQLIWLATRNNKGSIRAAARLMTLVENSPNRTAELLAVSGAWPEPRMIVGLTGSPGSGKSVLVDHLIAGFRKRHPDRRLGVIAVDPSSPFTGGALLGDRVRMMRHATDPMVFIRSSATRGRLGGLMLGAAGMVRIMGLIGIDIVLIETVGVGQGEVEVAKIADLVTLVVSPGQGDSVQLLKAGLMEIGDIFVINKADRPGARQLYTQVRAALSLRSCAKSRRPVEVCLISALEDRGVGELIELFENCYERDHSDWQDRRKAALENEVRQAVLEELSRQYTQAIGFEDVQRVLRGEVSLASLVKELSGRVARSESCGTSGNATHD